MGEIPSSSKKVFVFTAHFAAGFRSGLLVSLGKLGFMYFMCTSGVVLGGGKPFVFVSFFLACVTGM